MKKFFLIPLMSLLTCVMAWGADVAKIGDTYYTTLAKAVSAASAGDEIKLVSDVSVTSTVNFNKNLTLDLNGYNITNTNSTGLQSSCHAIKVAASKTLVITNSSDNQSEIKSTNPSSYPINFAGASSTVTINGNIVLTPSTTAGTQIFVGSYDGITINNNTSNDFKILSHKRFTNKKNGNPYSTNVIIGTSANFTTDAQNWVNWFATYSNAKISLASQIYMNPDYFEALKEYLENQNVNTLLTLTGTQVPVLLVSTSALTPKPIVVEIDNVAYQFTAALSAMGQSSEEHPATLTADWISVGNGSLLPSGKTSNYYLDLNGHTYYTSNSYYIMQNGKLTISNSAEQPAYIRPSDDNQNAVILIKPIYLGSSVDIELNIGQNIIVKADKALANGISIEPINTTTKTNCQNTVVNFDGQIDVTSPECMAMYTNGNLKDTNNFPVINIQEHAVLYADKDVAIYGAGYAKWNIVDGAQITGTSAIAIKSGILNMTGGTLHAAMSEEEAGRQDTWGNGVAAAGAALQIESNKGYAGAMELTISGGTLISDGFYAIYEYVDTLEYKTKVDSIAVTGGNFQGGILSSQDFMAKRGAFVSGGKWSKDITANIKAGENLHLLDNNDDDKTVYPYIVGEPTTEEAATYAEITNEKTGGGADETTTVVLTNAASASSTEDYTSDNVGDDPEVKISTATNSVVVSENTDVVATEGNETVAVKKITVEGTDTNPVELTVTEGATLNVGTGAVLIGDNAKITVEEGATLVVDGLIYGATENNFVVENSEEKPAVVLFSPETEFIKEDHPMATVTLKSKGYKRGEGDFVWQRFGIPANMAGMTRGSVIYDHENAASAFYSFDYANNKWKVMANEDAFTPFQCYEVTCGAAAPGTVYTFQCPIMGNADYTLNLEGDWNYYANSYTAPINIYELLSDFADTDASLRATVYVYRSEDNWWDAVNLMDYLFDGPAQTEIDPMQAFIFRRGTGSADPTINYENHIYNPIVNPSYSPAPARNRNDVSKAIVEITAADGSKDEIRLVESKLFSAEYDNGYDGAKYMNKESFNLFALINNEEMGKLATDNLEGTMLNMATKEQTSFTMTFSNVRGMSYAVRDMLTGTETMIAEGETYMFSVPANSNIDGRFQIVSVNKVLTDIENIEQAAAVKGIYTLSGQYVGNNYYNLPAGVYVVDGKKIVK